MKNTKSNRVSMTRILVSVILSVCVFILAAALLYGLKAAMVKLNDSWSNKVASEGADNESSNEGDITLPETDDPVGDISNENSEEAGEPSENTEQPENHEQMVNDGDAAGDADEEAGNTADTLPEDQPDNTEEVEEEPGESAAFLPEEETGNAEKTQGDTGNAAEPLPEDRSGIIEGGSDTVETEPPVNTSPNSTTGQFYFASFDVETNGGVKVSIPYLIIRLKGKVNTINPADLTDVVLTRDGIPISNRLTYTGNYYSFEWGYEDITDFYFAFENDNTEPGKYGLTGKYQGESFKVTEKIIERTITSDSADAGALRYVTWGYYTNADKIVNKVSELVFVFRGHQNAFYTSDLSELKCFRNGEEISVSFVYSPMRYYESDGKGSANTMFNLILKDPFTEPGRYRITGKYRGVSFESSEIVIP